MHMLWFNFILGSIFIFLCFCVWYCMIMSEKQRKIKIEPQHVSFESSSTGFPVYTCRLEFSAE